ncbi:hypothetical protein GCM10018782_04170 [Streptomyces griseoaurantiacus]|nr:hypothetical protein [Streptomyces sp. MH192]MCF0101157.1 hypothetical protein [Streptomyces sp. MH191]GHE33165.1 hypothetical protein GCM10018782_04170 [Streptomyces griseoaurantiacus]
MRTIVDRGTDNVSRDPARRLAAVLPDPPTGGAGGGRAGTRAPVGEPRTGVAPRPLRGHIQWQDWHNSAVGHSRFS